jgi:hypothetical protein
VCKDHKRAQKRVQIWRAPSVLVVGLKRYEHRQGENYGSGLAGLSGGLGGMFAGQGARGEKINALVISLSLVLLVSLSRLIGARAIGRVPAAGLGPLAVHGPAGEPVGSRAGPLRPVRRLQPLRPHGVWALHLCCEER